MQYHVELSELMDFFCQGEHQGFAEEDIQTAERALGVTLPVPYRNFLKTYGLDSINQAYNHINHPPEEIVTSYSCIQSTLEDWKSEFQKAKDTNQEERYQNNPYFTLWQLPQEKWPTITENYVLLWYENQGVWNAGYRLSDLQAGVANPPFYISTEDDDITFETCTEDMESFLLYMIWDVVYGYRGDASLSDPAQIDAVFSQVGIERSNLEWRGPISACMDDKQEVLYLYYNKEEYQELRAAVRNEEIL